MPTKQWLVAAACCLLVFPVAAGMPGSKDGGHSWLPPPSLLGEWQGEGRVLVSWCRQKSISLEIGIARNGTVHGRIGDSELVNGQIAPNSRLLVWLGNPEYAIEAGLRGPLVRAEGITRGSLIVVLDLVDGLLVGDLHTHDPKIAGSKAMMFSVTDIQLRHTAQAP